VGGHAYLINGMDVKRGLARGKNSWGRGWGKAGAFRIPLDDLDRLIREDGEACLALEVGK
jgi:C1A family cysteine protease